MTATTYAERTFLGQPVGVAYLAMTEAWERFSFYGMRALLVLYMVQELLLPGQIENVAGMDGYRAVIESIFGPLSTQAFASQTFGLYSGFVYFTPMFGGLIADRWLGARKTVLAGIVLMTMGHAAMVFDTSFLLALLLLVLGSGLLKGNVAAQVGHLYPAGEEVERARGYTIFSTGINIGATLGPFICGLLAQIYGWHYGFGLAGIMMVVAAGVYIAGWKHFADDTPHHKRETGPAAPMTRNDWFIVAFIVIVLLLSLPQFLAFDQGANVGMIWVADHVDLTSFLGTVPVPWFSSEDALASILIVPFLLWFWPRVGRGGKEPNDLTKMSVGAVVMALSMLALAAGAMQADGGGKASILWPVLAFFLSGASFMFTWPVLLSFVSRRAPAPVNALMMASVYLTAFMTGIGSGWLARFYEPLGMTGFWLLHVGISIGGCVLILLLAPMIRRKLDALEVVSTAEQETAAEQLLGEGEALR
ncbi:peptide MFS transporter [Aurantiacibacter gilvus]|uniref:Peptide MFS transporter n=1 Tax=Aurantiacibacter gilvus TaxID=3139141 RepID=A0ABU9II06_9SPHN